MLDCGHKSGAAWGIERLALNERNTPRRRNFSHFASFWFSSKYCYAFVIMHQFQEYIDSFSTITCRQDCSWDGKRWHCFLAIYVVSVWKKRSDIQTLPFVLPVNVEAAKMISSHVLLQGAGHCKGIGFERTRGDKQQCKNNRNLICISFPLKFYLYFLQIFS